MENYHRPFVYFICLVSAMGGLLFGYDWVVIGGAKPFYEIFFGIAGRPSMQALAMSIALLGCLLGATMAGLLADRYGRRRLLPTFWLRGTARRDGAGCSGPCVCLRDSFSCWRCLFPRVRAGWPAVDAGTKPTAC